MRKVELNIINAKILVEDSLIEAGVSVDEGKIVKVAKLPNLPASDVTVDSRNMLMIPGVVDAHVHLRDLDLSYKEDFSSGTQAAIMGGVTTVLDMPNTSPPTSNAERLKEKISKASNMIYSNVGFFGALSLEPRETSMMAKEGAIGFKLYLNDTQYNSLSDEKLLTRVLRAIKSSGVPLSVHAEFPQQSIPKIGPLNTKNEIELFKRLHDPQLEVDAVSMCLKMARESDVHVHVCHLSTESALNLVHKAKLTGAPVTAEVTPHHLLLSDRELYSLGSYAKMVPPLRTARDADSLMKGLKDGTVDIVASDHAPHAVEEKKRRFMDAPSGIPGLETMLPLILTEMLEGRITLKRVIQTMSENPSLLFKLKRVGKIAEGYSADLVLVDLHKERRIDAKAFRSKAKYTPFAGRIVKGIPVLTVLGGIQVMRDGEILGRPGDGKVIKHIERLSDEH
jgi:dihydroorotase (multifunctional complex type)